MQENCEHNKQYDYIVWKCTICGKIGVENMSEQELKCPNCDIELNTTSFKELETYEGFCYTVYIAYCPECAYVEEAWVD